MISVNTQPNKFASARNIVPYKITTDNNLITSGTIAYINLLFTGDGPDNPGTITFDYLGQTITLNFVSSLAAAGDLLYNVTPDTLVDYLTALALAIPLAHPLIQRDFTVSFDGTDTIQIQCKEAKLQADLNVVIGVANTSVASTDNGSDNEYRTMQNIADVYIEDTMGSGEYEKKISLSAPPDTDGAVTFNLQDIFRDNVGYDPPLFAESVRTECTGIVKRAYITPSEYYGNVFYPSILADPTAVNHFKIVNAGFDYYRQSQDPSFKDLFENNLTWLTNMPRSIKSSLNNNHFLYFYSDIDSTYNYYIKVYKKDGGINWQLLDSTAIEAGKVYRLPVVMSLLATYFTVSDILKFDVVISSSGTSSGNWLLDPITFVIDPITRQYNRYFLFSNSMGGFDTLWCYGRTKAEANHTHDDIQKPEPSSFTTDIAIPIPGYKGHINKEYTEQYISNSGWQPKEQIQHIARELPLAEKIYEIRSDGLVEVLCKNTKVEFEHDDEYRWAISFEWEYAFDQRNSKTTD